MKFYEFTAAPLLLLYTLVPCPMPLGTPQNCGTQEESPLAFTVGTGVVSIPSFTVRICEVYMITQA